MHTLTSSGGERRDKVKPAMNLESALQRDELFISGDVEKIWLQYCGFLDLPIDEFMVIQQTLLLEQIDKAAGSELGEKIMHGHKPSSVEEFRHVVPFTTYADYEPYLSEKREDALPAKPVIWARTSRRAGLIKWVPYTSGSLARLADDTLAAFILAGARRKGEVRVREGVKVVLNWPLAPDTTGIMAQAAAQRLAYKAIPPTEEATEMEFHERIAYSFQLALQSGVDFAASSAGVLIMAGEAFSQWSQSTRFAYSSLHPIAVLRLLPAVVKSKLAHRPMLPRDIWRIKGLVCEGTDSSIYREQIAHYWGVAPLDIYVAAETGFIAMQGWDKGGMFFVPYSNFYEFIPEEERLKSSVDKTYQPITVLTDELEAGKIYEIVVTNFYGGPFLRYRLGDLIKIVSLPEEKTRVNLPQMVFYSRTDDLIDIGGSVRLDEKTIWRAIHNIELSYEDWSARKEYDQGKPILHIYLELLVDGFTGDQIAHLIDQQLIALDKNYSELRQMTQSEPIAVTLLRRGTFQEYLKGKQEAGSDLANLRPPHMNASDAIINDLLSRGQNLSR